MPKIGSHQARRSNPFLGGQAAKTLVDSFIGLVKDFTDEELAEIDQYATEADINIWAASSKR